eukprot:SAG11_NODE_4398_length_1912_cov_6.987314_1_plen_219_part_00
MRSMGREYVPRVDCKKRKRTSGPSTVADEGDEGLDESDESDESDEEDGDEDVGYDVDELLEERESTDGRWEYKVRWLDYGPEYDTWEPAESLPSTPFADGMTLIERFEANGSVNERQRELLFANVDTSEPNDELSAPEAWARLVLECARRVGRTEADSVRYVCAQPIETQMDVVNINEVLRVEKSDVSMQHKYDSIATLIDSGLASGTEARRHGGTEA